jgi:hypothetical protein
VSWVTTLEWLDLTQTAGRSYNDLTGADGSNEFMVGGDFEGWRYATIEQLLVFYSNAGVITTSDRVWQEENYQPVTDLIDLVGTTDIIISPDNFTYNQSRGMTGELRTISGTVYVRTVTAL